MPLVGKNGGGHENYQQKGVGHEPITYSPEVFLEWID